jgi:hypothetical protein
MSKLNMMDARCTALFVPARAEIPVLQRGE